MVNVITGKLTANAVISSSTATPMRTKINIATPAYGSSYAGVYVKSFYSLLSSASKNGVAFSFSDVDYADIVTARNYLISNFYFNKPDCSHILFIDDDMGFEHTLIYQMLKLDKDVVGVIAPKRSLDLKALHANSALDFSTAYAHACDFIGKPLSAEKDGFVEVARCGTGILLISRQCITRMIQLCPNIVDTKRYKKMPFTRNFPSFITPFNKVELQDVELSEDLSFCHRWVEICKGKIYASVSSKIQHVAQVVVESKYADLEESNHEKK